jgi:hypothetical protein
LVSWLAPPISLCVRPASLVTVAAVKGWEAAAGSSCTSTASAGRPSRCHRRIHGSSGKPATSPASRLRPRATARQVPFLRTPRAHTFPRLMAPAFRCGGHTAETCCGGYRRLAVSTTSSTVCQPLPTDGGEVAQEAPRFAPTSPETPGERSTRGDESERDDEELCETRHRPTRGYWDYSERCSQDVSDGPVVRFNPGSPIATVEEDDV